MSVNNYFRSDLYGLYNIVQSSMSVYPKEVMIAVLKDMFSKDSRYHFVADAWGFPKNVDHTDLNQDAGLRDNVATRLFIGESFRFDGVFYPAILVKHNGSKYTPISFNREKQSVQYGCRIFQDGYGNSKKITYPEAFILAGAWESSMSIDIYCKSLRDRDELVDLVSLCFTDLYHDVLLDAGVFCKPISVSGASEVDDRIDKLFKQSITVDIRTEWRREIPISSIIDRVLFSIDFRNIDDENSVPAANLSIKTDIDYTDLILSI